MAGSLAIMTDAAHLASDCVSFVIGLLAIWISSRPPDHNMSFGYKRIGNFDPSHIPTKIKPQNFKNIFVNVSVCTCISFSNLEVIGAVVSILGIWVLTATLVIVAIQRIFSDDFNLEANTMMTIAGIGILINIA